MADPQNRAEQYDSDIIGDEADPHPLSDEVTIEFPPDRAMGLPFVDADVTDESFAERAAREEPEVWEEDAETGDDSSTPADERLEQIVELHE